MAHEHEKHHFHHPHRTEKTLHHRYADERERAERHGQEHIFRFWEDLSEEQKEKLIEHSLKIDYAMIGKLYNACIASKKEEKYDDIEEPDSINRYPHSAKHNEAIKLGEDAIRRGELAILLPAAGQASRLGYDKPKGLFPCTPITKKPLFKLFSEKILAAQKKYNIKIDIYIMTSEDNNKIITEFFEENQYFGLEKEQFAFFIQGVLPSIDKAGKVLLKSKHEVCFNPNGTGGIYSGLAESDLLDKMIHRDTKYISYFNLDNPFMTPVDPLYLGYHILFGSEISTKVVERKPLETIGLVVKQDGKHRILEYVNMTPENYMKTAPTGEFLFKATNIAIMILDVSYIEKVHKAGLIDYSSAALKKVQHIDENGNPVAPEKPNAYKFESFIFDPMPHAEKSMVFEVLREEEFAPIKNAEGFDSPATAYQMQTDLFKKWLLYAGVKPDIVAKLNKVEVSPLFAIDKEEFKEKISKDLERYEKELDGKEEYYFE
jgi:UDP-N-acetylglucosamine/UDP-N-acetylgalactosamine diphosphorylase